jgi:hypothetical protein
MKELSIEEKSLLLKDLCARLPYDVCAHIRYKDGEPCYGKLTPRDIQWFIDSKIKVIKPYLRPMSSMTKEEKEEYDALFYIHSDGETYCENWKWMDWMNAHHFDYRGLIEKGLAIAVTEENNPYK